MIEGITSETKITLKAGLLITLICSIIVFVLSTLWMHQTDITLLKANQVNVMRTLESLRDMPTTMSRLVEKVENLNETLKEHRNDSRRK